MIRDIKNTGIEIPPPSKSEVQKYVKQYEDDTIFCFKETDQSLSILFKEIFPLNKNPHEVLIKIHSLNSAYATNIPAPVFKKLTDRIIEEIRDIGKRLNDGDSKVVQEISQTFNYENGQGARRQHTLYSFATKYCSFHNPDKYPIYDSHVARALRYFMKDSSNKFVFTNNLREYEEFIEVIKNFKNFFNLDFTFREIDKYLYGVGRDIEKLSRNSGENDR